MLLRILNTPVRGLSLRRGLVNRPGAPLPSASPAKTPDSPAFQVEVNTTKPVPEPQSGTSLRTGAICQEPDLRLIIELKQPTRRHKDPFAALFEYLDRSGVPWKLHTKLHGDVFTGVCVTLSPGHNLEGLQKLESVKSLGRSELLHICEPVLHTPHTVLGDAYENMPDWDEPQK